MPPGASGSSPRRADRDIGGAQALQPQRQAIRPLLHPGPRGSTHTAHQASTSVALHSRTSFFLSSYFFIDSIATVGQDTNPPLTRNAARGLFTSSC